MSKKPRVLTDQDIKVWQQNMQGIKPSLPSKAAPRYHHTPTSKQISYASTVGKENDYQAVINSKESLPVLLLGSSVGVDSSTIAKIKQGKYVIDATLDLHGHSIDSAYIIFEKFIITSIQRKQRLLHVITGKSLEQKAYSINAFLPSWVNSINLRPLIVYFSYADQYHGGKGAFYILLKRVRVRTSKLPYFGM